MNVEYKKIFSLFKLTNFVFHSVLEYSLLDLPLQPLGHLLTHRDLVLLAEQRVYIEQAFGSCWRRDCGLVAVAVSIAATAATDGVVVMVVMMVRGVARGE